MMTEYRKPEVSLSEIDAAFSDAYRALWNDDVQRKIDADIERNRKADGEFQLPASAAGREIKVEQLSHDFVFGAHIFNFDQLGSDERNRRYKELYGTLFNSATIAFYWKQLELEEGHPRFRAEYRDSADFWNNCPEPNRQPHWRRPATDPVVEFCRSKGIRLHGHTLVWGNNRWQIPDWLISKIPFDYLKNADLERNSRDNTLISEATAAAFRDMSAGEMEKALPEYATLINTLTAKRIVEIAMRYGDKIDSWDVVNESAGDFGKGNMVPGSKLCKSWYGPMPGDYTYRGFKIAEGVFPPEAKLNINDYNLNEDYLNQVRDLRRRGCKIDIMGAQMHLFDPQICRDIADGKSLRQSPEEVRRTMELIGRAGLPIHLSEITITAPGGDRRGEIIQAGIARNLYRLWFSLAPMMGITWWNVVDGCGAPGEPAVSGLFTRDMEPKLSYFALDGLINREWRTGTVCRADKSAVAGFRGFRGRYRLSWTAADGGTESFNCHLS
ncbi:endo-1,4-beta-xylanase [Victivallis vadensis]|uniref:endo-1,4-beta-xylanase n=1 Tax=Victivallis vadensis TaxID=172901 RepID=UPI0026DBA98E|nr:endo-1,4-beta-xylanase [Victivallis vadensis]